MNQNEQHSVSNSAIRGHLIIVCCHAIYKPLPSSSTTDVYDESNWLLADFQRSNAAGKLGEHITFINHIEVGWRLLVHDIARSTKSVLAFSGGPTKIVDISESESYLDALKCITPRSGTDTAPSMDNVTYSESVYTERFSTDSFQNLLFSILGYWHKLGCWPHYITVVTHAFKSRRFLELHAPAIRWPHDRIRVLGLDPPSSRELLYSILGT